MNTLMCRILVALFCVVVASRAPAATSASPDFEVKVAGVQGKVTYRDEDGRTGELAVNSVLRAGMRIFTAKGAIAAIQLSGTGMLQVDPESEVLFAKLDGQSAGTDLILGVQLEVLKGSLKGNVKKLARASEFEVKSAKGRMAVRGTAFEFAADGTGKVWSGTVVVTYIIDGIALAPVTVTAGMQITPPSTPGGRPVVAMMKPEPPPPPPGAENKVSTVETVVTVSPLTGVP